MDRLCSTRQEAGFEIVSVGGEVDLSWSSELRRAILDAVGGAPAVLVEMADVSYIDSSGIAALVEGYQTARADARQFGLLAISDPVRAVLELARLDQVFPIHDTLDAARP
ncbi:MAG: STAS domain-containing protein [Pseudomonadota bacterium]